MKIVELMLLFIVIMITGSAMASTFTTITGQGYYTWNGQVICYYGFDPGFTFNLVNGVTATDTNGTPNEEVNKQAFGNYMCAMNPNQAGC